MLFFFPVFSFFFIYIFCLEKELPTDSSAFIVLDPIPTKGLTTADIDDLTRSTRELMLKELVTLSEKAQGRPMAIPASADSVGKATASGIDVTVG